MDLTRALPHIPLTSAELISAGVRPQLLASLALRRASGAGVAKSGDHYFDGGRPLPTYLTGIFDELAEAGWLRLAGPDMWGLRRVSLPPSFGSSACDQAVPDATATMGCSACHRVCCACSRKAAD